MQYKNLQSIKDAIEFTVDERLVVAAMKFNTSKLKTLLSTINVFANEIDKFQSIDKNELSNDITSRLRASYGSMCDAWKSMSSLEISQLPPAVTTKYNNLNKAFAACGLAALNDVLNNFKLKVISLSEEIKKKFDMFDKIVKSNDMLSKISLDNDGRALLNLDIDKIYPLQIGFYDVPVVETIKKMGAQFHTLAYNFAAFFGQAEDWGIKGLVNEDKSIIEMQQNTERIKQQGRAMLDRLTEQYCSNSAVAFLCTKYYDNHMEYKDAMYIGQLTDGVPNGIGRYCFPRLGNVFVGRIKEGNMLKGVYIYANGDKYEGEFKDGEYNGYGVYIYADGDKYEGEFKDGEYNGHGVFTLSTGDVQSGTWVNGEYDINDIYSQYCLALKYEKEGDIEKAISILTGLGSYLDSAEHLANCLKQKKKIQDEKEYNNAIYLQGARRWKDAIIAYKKIKNYKDSNERLKYCKKRLRAIKNYRIRQSLKSFFSSVFFVIISFFAKLFKSIKKLFVSIFSRKTRKGSSGKYKESKKRTGGYGSSEPNDVNKTIFSWIILICGILSVLFSAIYGLLGVSIIFIIVCKILTRHFKSKYDRLFGKAKFGKFLSVVAIIVVAIKIFVAIASMAAGQTINFLGLFF